MKWKNQSNKQCLLIKGARQVGKTFIIERFISENYQHFTIIDFVKNPTYQEIFDGDLDVETLVKQISLRVPKADLRPGESVIFF